MQTRKDDKQSDSRYRHAYDLFSRFTDNVMSGRPWRRLGLFSYYDAPYFETESLYLSPKQVMVALGKKAAEQDQATVFVMDALEEGGMGFSSEADFNEFMVLFDDVFPDSAKFYFGAADSARIWLHALEHLKICTAWLAKKPNVLAQVLSDASLTGEDLGPADVSFDDMLGLRDILVEKLGPPSLTDEVFDKVKKGVATKTRGVGASDYAGEALGLIVSPGTAVTHGVKYLGKFVSTVKDRRKKEVKDIYLEWRRRVESAYSQENLSKFFESAPDYSSGLAEAVSKKRPALVVTETRATLFDLFLPLLLQDLMDNIGYVPPSNRPRVHAEGEKLDLSGTEEGQADGQRSTDDQSARVDGSELPTVTGPAMTTMIEEPTVRTEPQALLRNESLAGKPRSILFLDAATRLSSFERSFKFALGIPDRFSNVSVAASFFTDAESTGDALQEELLKYMGDRALIMDLNPALFDAATLKLPMSKKAWLEGRVREMADMTARGGAGFLEYCASADEPWALRVLNKPAFGLTKRVRRWLGQQT